MNFKRGLRDGQWGIDAETVIEFFVLEKREKFNIFFDYETIQVIGSVNVYEQILNQKEFILCIGDVVFDYTYNTNKYSLRFYVIEAFLFCMRFKKKIKRIK